MSFNQSRAEKSESSSQYRKLGRSGSSGQQRNLSGGNGKGGGGGTAAPPPSSSSLPSNRSFKKSNNVQGGPPRASGLSVISDYNNASAARTVQNGAHVQPPLHGASDAPVTGVSVKSISVWTQKSTRVIPKAPSSHAATVISDTRMAATPAKGASDAPVTGVTVKPTYVWTQKSTKVIPKVPSSHAATVISETRTPATPAKGDASRSFPLQFGSISPVFMKGLQIPARTSSALPKLDAQKHDQACHDSSIAVPALPTPSIPKQQLPQEEPGTIDHPNSGEAYPMSKGKRDILVSAAPPATHTQRPSLHPIFGISMQMPFRQPQVPVRFGAPDTQIQSQDMSAATSLPIPMPLPMVSPSASGSKDNPFLEPTKAKSSLANGKKKRKEMLQKAKAAQKPSLHPISGISVQMPFHQPQVPVQFGAPNTQIQSQGMTAATSLPMVSPSASGSKDNPFIEPNKAKNSMAKGKKKRKEMLQKAKSAGTTSDLCMAYEGPEEKKETVTSTKSNESTSSISPKQESSDASQDDAVASENSDQSKNEPDGWEDAADISTPKLETSGGKQDHGGLKHHLEDGNGVVGRKYSRDFLMKFAYQCTEFPEGEITSDIPEVQSFLRTSGMGDDDKWSKHPVPLASGQDNPFLEPNKAKSTMARGKKKRKEMLQKADAAGTTVFQKGLIPSPQTPLQVMHKAEKKYEVGKVTDEVAGKQRQLKGILNKLTPQNFENLFEQVKQVNIDNVVTLNGVISQIFDKALMEPTFCEMYANFCCRLAGELPDLSADNEKITFKRLLLSKCQEEFERGVREQEETNNAEEEGEAKQSEEEREEKRMRAQRRMLGNIRLMGELYKKRMLKERIMHECIKKLLGQPQNPDEEDVEALCKLMSTIGEMIDHPKAKEFMDAYFDMMANLSNNMKFSSRLRFMLKDSIDLRKNKWQQRRKVEGPKKIDEVHRDAAHEKQAQVGRLACALSMSSSVRRGQPMDFGPRGSTMLSSPSAQMGGFRGVSPQLRGYGTQDIRHSFSSAIGSNEG